MVQSLEPMARHQPSLLWTTPLHLVPNKGVHNLVTVHQDGHDGQPTRHSYSAFTGLTLVPV